MQIQDEYHYLTTNNQNGNNPWTTNTVISETIDIVIIAENYNVRKA